ncbi:hypothetical protein ACSHWB_26350 [Lentzea sp. HUAS TT2]|uniref:hypothetical protein n=1 Tax=Lentzea sp. HUAS TT2 TaxID=3447454 RepID=UPI003F71886F
MSNNQLTGAADEALVSFLVHHELGWVHQEQQRPVDCGVDGQIQVEVDRKLYEANLSRALDSLTDMP